MTLLADAIAAHNVEPWAAAKIDRFVTLFETWNRSINLSAARTRAAIEEHVVDSLAIIPYLREALLADSPVPGSSAAAPRPDDSCADNARADNARADDSRADNSRADDSRHEPLQVLDVGSGGGFPVVIAAIVLSNVRFVALEPVHKKHAFLRTAARELDLHNLEPRAERIEEHVATGYDVAMSRATFELNEWLDRATSMVRGGGTILGFEAIPVELPANTERLTYQFLDKTRSIVRRKV